MIPAHPDAVQVAEAARRVGELLARQVALYHRLERLSGDQRACIEKDDTRPLLALLAARRRLTASLVQVGEELAPFRRGWDELKTRLAPPDRKSLEAQWREVNECLRRILDGDEADARLLAVKRDATAGELRGLDAARRTISAYKQDPAATGACGLLEGTEA